MNRLLVPIIISIIFFVSCKSGGSGEAYTIRMRLAKGDTFSHNIEMNMTMKTATVESKMNMNMESFFEVLNDDSTGKELKMTYRKAHMAMDLGKMNGMNKMSDSILNKNNQRIIGKTVTIKLSNNNEITEVTGLYDAISDSTDEATRLAMQKIFSKEQLNNLFGMMFSMYPKGPVRVGDTWSGKTKMNMGGMDMGISIKYTLRSVKNGLADIDVDGTIDGKGKLTASGMNAEMNMSGDEKGTYVIKMQNGYLDHADYKLNMKAEVEIMNQKMPVTMKMDCVMKGK